MFFPQDSRAKFRTRNVVIGTVVVLLLVLIIAHRMLSPSSDFPVERVELINNTPRFEAQTRGLLEDRMSIAYAVHQRTWKSVALVILDARKKEQPTAFAFTGGNAGKVYLLHGGGGDTYEIISEASWVGDPRRYVLRSDPPAPSPQ